MKTYLAITGTIFALMAVMHVGKAIDERRFLTTHPVEFLSMAALGLVAGALAVWAWRLWRGAGR